MVIINLCAKMAIPKRGTTPQWCQRARTWAVALAGVWVSSLVQAQVDNTLLEFDIRLIREEIPEGVFKLYRSHYISLNGLFEYDPFDNYQYDKENAPTLFDALAIDSPDAINVTMETNFYGVDGSQFADEETMLVSAGVVDKRMLTGGRYKSFKWSYWQPNPVIALDQPAVLNGGWRQIDTKVFFPVVKKIPYYIASSALSRVTFASTDSFVRYFEPQQYSGGIGITVSLSAMDLVSRSTEEDHFACPVWYEFKFMGYVDGFPDGIVTGEDMGRLPDGVTFVPAIDFCTAVPKVNTNIQGCAIKGGTQVAVVIDLVASHVARLSKQLGPVVLHELLHAQGANHVTGDSENLMTDGNLLAAPYLDQEQCEMLIKKKSYVMGFSGLEPWE